MLVVAGTAAIGLALPLAAGVAVLLLILVLSYRQVIAAYPQGGGAYMVTRDNLGGSFAAICAAALLVDYVLTVAVSVSAGTAALASAIPSLQDLRVEISVAFVLLLMWGNLRGIRESGKIFAVPTYVYILSLGGVVVLGVYRILSGQIGPIEYSPAEASELASSGEPLAVVSLFLLLHAYAAGTTALTGVEAIADGVPAFRKPEAQNAQRTLVAMALIMGFLFIGITYLAIQLDAHPSTPATRPWSPSSPSTSSAPAWSATPCSCSCRSPPCSSWSWRPTPPSTASPSWPASPPRTRSCPASSASAGTGWSTPTGSWSSPVGRSSW